MKNYLNNLPAGTMMLGVGLDELTVHVAGSGLDAALLRQVS